jgi:hypothetical protein
MKLVVYLFPDIKNNHMKYLVCCLIMLSGSVANLSAKIGQYEKFTYKIKAEIEGLSQGDTIVFEKIILPGWNLEPAFQVIVEEDNGFSYEGTAYHNPYFLMTYKPLSGKEVVTDRRGITLLVDSNEITIKGNADNIYYCKVEGGVYNNTYVQEINALENKLGAERGLFRRLSMEAEQAGDMPKAKEYREKFNSFTSDNRADYDKRSKLQEEFMEKYPSSELNVLEMLQTVTYTPLEKLEAYYASMNEDARKSYYGILLRQEMDNMSVLEPGNDAPDFMLDMMDGQRISLNDCIGSYLLIYHFGLCPGSLMIDGEVTSLYAEYKERLKVIGVTEDVASIKSWYETVGPSDKMMNMELKPALESMVSHPWSDAENKGDNRQLAIDYAFAGLPFFVFIFPEGKILARGFI